LGTVSRFLRSVGLKRPKQRKEKPPVVLTEENIKDTVAYAESIFSTHDGLFRERGISVQGCAYLEIGPGRDLSPQLLMVDRGASVTVADRFLSEWDEDYHPRFYRAFLSRVGRSPAVERVLGQSGYDGVIDLVSAPAEDLRAIADTTFDIVVSNAVLEHIYDLRAAARELRRVSKAEAIHLHQVDFRDHRDLARPLEYLLLSRRGFTGLAGRNDHEFGCQTRPLELARIFEEAGYSIEETDVNDRADGRYLDDFIPRLRRSWFSRYKQWKRDDLQAVGVRYWMRA
jgi:SAM-dependent methyltransferase